MIEALFPASLRRCTRRVGTVLLTLALLVAVFFPAVAVAGTENATDRLCTAAALALVGLVLRFSNCRPRVHAVSLVMLALSGALIPAPWVVVLGVAGLLYLGLTLFPRVGGRGDGAPDTLAVAESPELPGAEVVRENVEAVAMALVLALTVREFAVEAFVIPTGSMQPTILGADRSQSRTGDRLVAAKLPVLLHDLPRFSIVVFRWPLFRQTNYIKRLIGLPGEEVEILDDGNILVDGKLVSKPDAVQESLWLPQLPAAAGRAVDYGNEFETSGTGDVEFGPDGVRLDAVGAADDGPREAWANCRDPVDRCIDRRVTATFDGAALGEGGAALLRVESPGRRVELAVSATSVVLTAPGIDARELDVLPLGPTDVRRYGLAAVDGEVRVYLEGRQVARLPHGEQVTPGASRRAVSVGVRGGATEARDVVVEKDIHYVRSGTSHWNIPEGCYVMLGDNTTSSNDSRLWDANVVRTRDGREFVAAPRIRLEESGPDVSNWREVDGAYEFVDAEGVPRRVPTEDVSVEYGARRSYVEERDLIGRAFFIFYPFPPFGDFRPRFLP